MRQPAAAMVAPAEDDLKELAARINAAHADGEDAARNGLEQFRAAGEMLIKAKKRLKHGEWGKWLEAHVKFSHGMACKYMRISREWGKFELSSNLTEALRSLIEEASDDEATTDTVVDEPAAPPPKDPVGRTVPRKSLEIWTTVRPRMETLCRELDKAMKELKEIGKTAVRHLIHPQSLETHLTNLRQGLWQRRPTHVCPYCEGNKDDCRACHGQGLVTTLQYESSPEGDKKSGGPKA